MQPEAPRPGPPCKSPTGEKRTGANFKLDPTTKERIKLLSKLRGISQADLITYLVAHASSGGLKK